MDEDLIESLADALSQLVRDVHTISTRDQKTYGQAVHDAIEVVAVVVNQFQPTYDTRYFYARSGYQYDFPTHPIKL